MIGNRRITHTALNFEFYTLCRKANFNVIICNVVMGCDIFTDSATLSICNMYQGRINFLCFKFREAIQTFFGWYCALSSYSALCSITHRSVPLFMCIISAENMLCRCFRNITNSRWKSEYNCAEWS